MRVSEWIGIWPKIVPSVLQIEEFLAFLLVAAGLTLIGAGIRYVAGDDRRAVPEADLLVGWSAVIGLFVGAGVFTGIPFTWVAGLAGICAALAATALRRGKQDFFPADTVKIAFLLMPLFLLTLSQTASENDDIAQWLPNLRYLLIVDHFPAPGLPISDSIFPSYPYALALVGYLVGKITGTLPVTAVDHFNILLLGSFALLLTRIFQGGERPANDRWRTIGLALAACTLLCPTFVPRLVLSNYADCATAISLAFATILMIRLIESESAPRLASILQATLAVAALVLIKQANLVLLAVALGGIGLVAVKHPRRLLRLAPVLGGGALFYLAWRHQVGKIGGGEMPIAGFDQWQWSVLPDTFSHMLTVVANKGGYFGLALVLSLAAIARFRAAPLAVVFAVSFWGFTAFLTWVYLAVYLGYEGRTAASFWRYNTELGLLQMAAMAAMAGTWWQASDRPALRSALRKASAIGLILVVFGPLIALPQLRFDLNPAKDHVRTAAIAMTPLIPRDAKLFVADPMGSGFFTSFVRWHLGFQSPVVDGLSVFNAEGDLPRLLQRDGITHIYVISSSAALEAVLGQAPPPSGTSLFQRDRNGEWTQTGFWPFEGFASIGAFRS